MVSPIDRAKDKLDGFTERNGFEYSRTDAIYYVQYSTPSICKPLTCNLTYLLNLRLLVCLCLLSIHLSGQEARSYFHAYTSDDGLGGEAINDLLVDQYGYLWSAAYSGLHRFDGYEFLSYPADILDSCSMSHPIATCLLEDRDGNLWVGTSGGLNRLDRSTNCFQSFFHQPDQPGSLPGNDITDLALGANGTLYVATTAGLARYDPKSNHFQVVPTGMKTKKILADDRGLFAVGPAGLLHLGQPQSSFAPFSTEGPHQINDLLVAGDSILIATNRGLYHWRSGASELVSTLPAAHPMKRVSFQSLCLSDDRLWLATRGAGLGVIDLKDGSFHQYRTDGGMAGDILDNHLRALVTDDHHNLWIGGYTGLNRLDLSQTAPRLYNQQLGDIKESHILELGTDHLGGVYYYERWQGLFRSDGPGLGSKKMDFPSNDFLVGKDLNFVYTDRAGISWLLRGNDRIYRYNAQSGKYLAELRLPTLADRRLNGIAQDVIDDNTYWLASSKGLGKFNLSQQTINWFSPSPEAGSLNGEVLTVVLPAEDGKVWLSCGDYYNDRLGYFDPTTEKFSFLKYSAGDPKSIAGGRVKQLAKHPDGSIWAAASQGIIRVSPTNFSARLITKVEEETLGIPEALLIDQNGNVWFSSGDRLGRYVPQVDRLSIITCSGIRQFSNAAAAALPDGRLLFAGLGGIIAIQPNQPLLAGNYPKIVFNTISVAGKPAAAILPDLSDLSLPPGERSFSLFFSGLFFDRTRHIQYAYRLGQGKWQLLGNNRSLTFTDLKPGNYQLSIRSSDGQANWNPLSRKLAINIPHFWHETRTAQWGFVGFGLVLLTLLGRFLVRRKLEKQAHEQLVALDAFKSRLFTDLTHEFRTPLTLILGPARRLGERARQQQDPTLGREARRIDRQGRKLLQLINQLLDLRKLEAGQLTVEREPILLNDFFRSLTETFRPEAERRNIQLSYEYSADAGSPPPEVIAIDRIKQESILLNLMSNALKFTQEGGKVVVRLTANDREWYLGVTDTGQGIPPEQQEQIFQRFARAHGADISGTGIGLSFVQDLTKLLEGTISLQSKVGAGSTFNLRFPIVKAAVGPVLVQPEVLPRLPLPAKPEEQPARKDLPLLLIVEDEVEVAEYLRESLCDRFRVSVANDGEEGLNVAFNEVPDLVVSDVMMPNLNGLQLCARLKNDPRTSHLPVLLLTARTAEEHRLEGLDRGADAYLSKPFSEKELHLRLRNLLVLRDRTTDRLRKEFLSSPTGETVSHVPQDAGWLTDLRSYIENRLDDPDLSGADLEQFLAMSRSQLQRKLQSVLGMSPRKLVNEVRLKTAACRLRETDAPISAIAYDCGFRDPKYFGRVFKERFGAAPRTWREQRAS
jgi:signal transduction histidine kinase/CheY-like chemotaxis protein/ligand-binding sensor domain-containing protein